MPDLSETPPDGFRKFRRATSNRAYRPASGIVLAITIVFSIEMALSVLLGAMSLVEATVLADQIAAEEFEGEAVGAFYLGYGCIGILYMPVYLACVVLFCVWVYRANKNARALGAQGMEFTPGWCVGWFFVPFANLVKPFQAVREIHQASDPEANASSWRNSHVSASIGWWWALWIGTNFLANIQTRLNFSEEPDLLIAGSWLGVVTGVLAVPSALLAMNVVRSIHRRLEQKADLSLLRGNVADAVDFVERAPNEAAETGDDNLRQKCPWCEEQIVATSDGRCSVCGRPV